MSHQGSPYNSGKFRMAGIRPTRNGGEEASVPGSPTGLHLVLGCLGLLMNSGNIFLLIMLRGKKKNTKTQNFLRLSFERLAS